MRVSSLAAWLGSLLLIAGGCVSGDASTSYEWTVEETHRWTELPSPRGEGPGFQRLDSTATGAGFVNHLREEQYLTNRHLVNGSGVAVGDVDGDGWPDLYLARLSGSNALYLNRGGEAGGIHFEKAPEGGGAALAGEYSTGVALADVTGDGLLDLLVTTLGGPNVLYENEGGGSFRRIKTAGLHAGRGSTTMALADLNGDRALDLYVANYKKRTVKDIYPPNERRFEQVVVQEGGEYRVRSDFREHYDVRRQGNRLMRFEQAEPDRVYFNDGTGRFEQQSWREVFRDPSGAPSSEAPGNWGLVARLEDLNGDGTPDLYVCNDFESPDLFYRGVDERGQLRAMPEWTMRTTSRSSMSIATTDLERDGDVDFFVADMLGVGYERRQQQVAIATPVPRRVGDVTTRMQEMINAMQMDRGDGTYAQMSRLAGMEASGWTWASTFVDVNLDGLDDLLLSTGHAYDAMNADTQMRLRSSGMSRGGGWRRSLLKYPDLNLKNMAFRNEGDRTFARIEDGWGLGTTPDVGHGMATGDFDRDGDLDVVINRLNRTVGIYRNEATAPRVAVRLAGRAPNTGGIGATIRVRPRGAKVPAQEEAVIAGGEYVSDSGGTHAFAVGVANSVRIEVRWPEGGETVVEGRPGRLYEIRQSGAEPGWREGVESKQETAETPDRRVPSSSGVTDGEGRGRSVFETVAQRTSERSVSPLQPDTSRHFQEISSRLGHSHAETKYRDFQRQPLLSRRLSQQGPGGAWADLDGDGDDDLLIGTGRSGQMAYYRNDGTGHFTRVRGGALDRTYERDLTGIVTIPGENGATVLVGRSNFERQPDDQATPSRILVFEANADGLRLRNRLQFGRAAIGPLALADIDGDGDLDLFAGGRHRPGRYPESASSKIFLNNGGEFQRADSRSRVFANLGLITGAVFADLSGDDSPDLLLASEWGPIHYFENRGNGRFVNRTEEAGLSDGTGFWRGVDVGDFNNDGRLDVAAANWGWNSMYGRPESFRERPQNVESPRLEHPLRVYYSDFDGNGVMDLIEAHYHSGRDEYVPYKDFTQMGQAMRYLRRKVKTFERFSQMSLPEILGKRRFEAADTKEVTTLSHMVFLNREEAGHVQFEGHALPWWSQLSAGFAPSVADLDGDGNQDLLLSQNFFATQVKIPRQDGGRALWLRGDGTGHFTEVKGHESGLLVYGEQRAAPVGDVDRDGRVDVLVTQNGAETKLFHNVGATPGVRVRLEGSESMHENRRGVGAIVHLRYADGSRGPATPITAGSSYWSQHSRSVVLGHGDRSVESVQVRWPDGTTTERAVDPDSLRGHRLERLRKRTVTISHPGQ